jgi:flavin reductase (DIM6/NTAB) family NADH-FMN oxidoreductase RutF
MRPVSTIDTHAGFDPRDLRGALGSFATGVCIVTTCTENGDWVGLTVNSFSSVSLDPPLVLWSLDLKSPSRALFENASHYAVNVLAADQEELSNRFASRIPDKFAGLDCVEGIAGVPLLPGCLSWFECALDLSQAAGDHLILIGHIDRFALDKSKTPADSLIFQGGGYRRIA